MKTRRITPSPAPAHGALIFRVSSAYYTRRYTVALELQPERVQVVDFYPLPPSQQQRRSHGSGS